MKVLVRKNATTKTGYELVVIADDGKETITAIDGKHGTNENGSTWMELPTNPMNRQWFTMGKDKTEAELTAHVARTITQTERAPRKPDEDFLTGEDRETFLALKEKIRKAREEANKKPAMTDLEKAKRAVERAQAQLKAAQEAAKKSTKKESK